MSVLAIDQGTSATKALVVADDGRVLAAVEAAVHPQYLSGGRVEQDPRELLASVLDAGAAALAKAAVDVDAVALANQGETVLAWDLASGDPLSTAIVWQDGRAQEVCDARAEHRDLVAARTGLVLDPYFSAPKMTWLRENATTDGVVTTTDTWLLHALTGEFVTDASTASRSLILDLDTVAWDSALLDVFGLTDERLPRIVDNDAIVGTTRVFGRPLPVAGAVVDQQAALLGEGCIDPGDAKCTYGTGAFLLAQSGSAAPRSGAGLTTSVAWRARGRTQYCVDGQVFTAASAIRWLADVGLLADPRDLDAAASPSSDGVLFVPALAGLAAPWWRSDARAALTGLSLATSRGSIVRAVIEGLAAQVADLAAAVTADLGTGLAALRVDGGLTRSSALMQAQADLLQVPVEVYPSAHATAMGAAALARMALDLSLTVATAPWSWTAERTYEPQWSRDRADDFLSRWRAAVTASLDGPSIPAMP